MITDFLQYFRQLVGSPPSGSESIEYVFACCAAILLVCIFFKFILTIITLFSKR